MESAQIRLQADQGVDELISLYEWLRQERSLTGAVQMVNGAAAVDALSSGAPELLTVALSSAGVGTALARSLIAWLGTRRSAVTAVIAGEHGSTTVSSTNLHPKDAAALIEQALRGDGHDGGDDHRE